MALLGKKKEKPEMPSVLKTVLDMLALNTPEPKIRADLKGMGLGSEEAESVLASAKREYGTYLETTLTGKAEKYWGEKKADISEMVGAEADKRRKDVLLQLDLKMLEAKNYTDKRAADILSQMETLRSDVYNTRAEAKVAVDTVSAEIAELKLSGIEKRLLAIGIAFAGLFIILYPLATINVFGELAGKSGAEALAFAGLWGLLVLFGVLLVRAGMTVYSARPKRAEHELFKK